MGKKRLDGAIEDAPRLLGSLEAHGSLRFQPLQHNSGANMRLIVRACRNNFDSKTHKSPKKKRSQKRLYSGAAPSVRSDR